MREETYPFVMKQLPYEYDDLLPVLDEATLHFHHDKHYKNYVDGLNAALADYPEYHSTGLRELLTMIPALPAAIQTPVKHNGGGVYLHELYFDGMKGREWIDPEGCLKAAIIRDFGTVKQWKDKMKQEAAGVFGSGWAVLVTDDKGKLSIVKTANQDVPDLRRYEPILAADVWEHAYYLQYQNRRIDYVQEWFRLINWRKAARRYEEAFGGKVMRVLTENRQTRAPKEKKHEEKP